MTFTVAEKIEELDRELAQRRKVYPRWIELGRIGRNAARRQVEILEAIRDDYVREAARMGPRESGLLLCVPLLAVALALAALEPPRLTDPGSYGLRAPAVADPPEPPHELARPTVAD